MNSTIASHIFLLLPAVLSGACTAALAVMNKEMAGRNGRSVLFIAACVCIITVILGTLLVGGSQEEIVCYLLILLSAALIAQRFRRGGGT